MKTATLSRLSLQQSLDKHLDAALRGQESILIVSGDAGSGKTRLIQHFSREAQLRSDNLLVAYSACNAITGVADAYMPFREILQQLSGDVDESLAEGYTNAGNVSRVRKFIQTSARALVENGPDLVDVFVPGGALITRLGGRVAQRWTWFDKLAKQVDVEKPRHISTEIKQDNIFEQYTRVIEAISEEASLLLIIDDLHWSDKASLGLLFQLSRRLVNNRVLIIAATRPPDDSAEMRELSNLLRELRRYFGEAVLDLSAQPKDEFVKEYLEAVGIDSERKTIDLLVKHTGGNPLFVVELLRQFSTDNDIENFLQDGVAGPLPARLSAVFERIFRALDDPDRQILATASVQGFEFWAELIADINNDTPLSVLRRLGGTLLRDRNIVVDSGPLDLGSGTVSRFEFRHDLLREYVYQSVPDNERRLLHQMVADQIELRTIESIEEYCLILADQYEHARDWDKALRYRVMAAERTERACAPTEAADHYSAAIEICAKNASLPATTVFDLRLRLASQLALSGEYSQAEDVARRTLESVAGSKQASVAWLAIGRISRMRRDFSAALDALVQAESMLPSEKKSDEDSSQTVDILLERAVINYFQRDRNSLLKTNQALADLIEVHAEPYQQVSYFSSRSRQALTESRFSPNRDAASFSKKAIDSAQPPSPNTVFGFAFATLWQEQFEEAIELFEKAQVEATRHGDSAVQLQALVYLSLAQRRSGNIEEVERLVAKISSILEFVKMPEYPAVLAAQNGWLAYRQGNFENALALTRSASRYWTEKKSPYPFCWIADWTTFAISEPGSADAVAAANNMLSPNQAWQRGDIVAALETYLSDGIAIREYHDVVVETAKRESYL